MSAAGLDHHLASCPDCARWVEHATRLTRTLRLGAVDVPDLSAQIVAQAVLPVKRVLRRRLLLRIALGVVAAAQIAISVPALAGFGIGMPMSEHIAHESAAWNVAIGVAFAAAALVPRRAAGLVPLLGTFVVVLAALSVHDALSGMVTLDRELTHVAALAGLVLLVVLDRAERALPPRSAPAVGEPAERRKLRGVA